MNLIKFKSWSVAMISLLSLALTSCLGVAEAPQKKSCVFDYASQAVFSDAGGDIYINVVSDRAWQIIKQDETQQWCSFDRVSGPSGTTRVKLTVEAKVDDVKARLCKFQLRAGADGMELEVIQSGIPVVYTRPVSDILSTSVVLNGEWLFAIDANVTALGFEYRKVGDEVWKEIVSDSKAKGAFKAELTGLESTPYQSDENPGGVDYEYRAFVKTTEYPTQYGEVTSFKTAGVPLPKTVAQIRALYEADKVVTIKPYKIDVLAITDTTQHNYISLAVVDAANPTTANNGIFVVHADGSKVDADKGDKLEIDLTGAKLKMVKDGIVVEVLPAAITKKEGKASIEPVVVAHTALSRYMAQLVTIENTQLIPAFMQNQTKYTKWSSIEGLVGMDVKDSETGYNMRIESTATTMAAAATQFGSGTLTGVVTGYSSGGSANSWVIYPRSLEDIKLTGITFESLLNFKFSGLLWLGGDMKVGTSNGNTKFALEVSYKNATGNEVVSSVDVVLGGDPATDEEGNEVMTVSFTEVMLAPGDGVIQIYVRGTPMREGELELTINSIKDAEGKEYDLPSGIKGKMVKRTVLPEVTIPVGNWEARWNQPSGTVGGPVNISPLALASNSYNGGGATSADEYVKVSPMTPFGLVEASGGAAYKNLWGGGIAAGNSPASPSSYVSYTVTVVKGPVSLYEFSASSRVLKEAVQATTPIMFSLDNGNTWTTSVNPMPAGETNGEALKAGAPLASEAALQNLAAGTVVTIRLVPVELKSPNRWGLGKYVPNIKGQIGEVAP